MSRQDAERIREAYSTIHMIMAKITSNEDHVSRSHCKQELYHLQCWLNDEYKKLPVFIGEEKWEQDRIIKILKDSEE